MFFLLVPYGFASWALEYAVITSIFAKRHDAEMSPGSSIDMIHAVGKANLISYCLPAISVIVIWVTAALRSA